MPSGPCVKQRVTATIVLRGDPPPFIRFVGSNDCDEAQQQCPRGDMPSGVGYELCKSVCRQRDHAEVAAAKQAFEWLYPHSFRDLAGAVCYIEGHTRACFACTEYLRVFGITDIRFGPPPIIFRDLERRAAEVEASRAEGPFQKGDVLGVRFIEDGGLEFRHRTAEEWAADEDAGGEPSRGRVVQE